jgi:hypothetical protein
VSEQVKPVHANAPLRIELALLTTPEQLEEVARLMRLTDARGLHSVPELVSPDGTTTVRLFNVNDPHVAQQLAQDDADRKARRSGAAHPIIIPGGPVQ